MALINCPECGKSISNTSENCIHCGCPIKKSKKINKKTVAIFGGLIIIIVVAIVIIFNLDALFPHTIKNTHLMKLLEYTSSAEIKKDLGDDYKHMVWDSLDSTSDEYEDITIDGKEYAQVEISYESDGDYERIYLDSDSIWTEEEYKILIKDFIEQFGSDYDYEEDEYNGNVIYDYSWEMSLDRRISLSIRQDSDDKSMYWVRINSFHN